MDRIRAFLAVDFSAFFQKPIEFLIHELKKEYSNVKWISPAASHVTLHFFGDIDQELIAKIIGSVEPVTQTRGAFELMIQGVGAFPDFSRPAVLWAGLAGDAQSLIDIKQAIDLSLEKIGILPEKRSYHPHLTLGRIRLARYDRHSAPRRLAEAVLRFTSTEKFIVTRLILIRSDPGQDGPRHIPLHDFKFSTPLFPR